MTIVHILTSICTTGGTSAKVLALAKHSKIKIVVFAQANDNDSTYIDEWKKAGVELCLYPRNTSVIESVLLLNKLVKSSKASIIHCYFPLGMYQAVCVKLFYHHLIIVRSMEGALKRRLTVRLLSRACKPFVDCFVNISEFMARYYYNFEKGKRNVVIYNCAAHIGDPTKNTPLHDGICRMVSISGLNAHKNIPLFVEVSRILKQKGFAHIITICGDGPLRKYVEEKSKEYGIEKNLKLAGYVTDPLPFLYESDIYLHPANCEGFGMAVAEAMSVGMPVIVSDQAALPELIQEGETGFIRGVYKYEDWADLVINLYNDIKVKSKVGKSGLKYYERNFTPEIFADNMKKFYKSL